MPPLEPSRLETARSVLSSLRGDVPRSVTSSWAPLTHSFAPVEPASYSLRLSAFTEAGCPRMTAPFAPSTRTVHLHSQGWGSGESVAVLGALWQPALAGDYLPAHFPTLTRAESYALRDGVGSDAGQREAVDQAGSGPKGLLHPLGLQGWAGGQQQPQTQRAATGVRLQGREGYEAAGQRAARAADGTPAHAWPTGVQHSFHALRLSVLPQEPAQPSARMGFTPRSLELLGSLKAWELEGKVIEQRRKKSSEGVL